VASLDPDVPLFDERTLSAMLAAASGRERLLTVLLGLFAALALTLAAVGVYGLVAFAVAQRRREIGIRVALGAGARDVLRAVVGRAALLCAGGVLVGLVVAALAGRLMRGVLHEVSPADPGILTGATGGLFVAALLAAWLPARRAIRVDPLETLRE
jgi:ABC-type antimicrobial peptide transport system permease subunit